MEDKKITLYRMIAALVALVGIAVSVVSFIWRLNSHISIGSFILVAVYYGFVIYYGLFGYKKPHGNMVRYLLLILAVYIAASIIVTVSRWDVSWIIFAASNFAAVFVAYMAGRLSKVKKNIFIAALITVLLAVKCFWPISDGGTNLYTLFVLDRTLPLFMWATVAFIYFFRYSEHKQAGIAEDSEE